MARMTALLSSGDMAHLPGSVVLATSVRWERLAWLACLAIGPTPWASTPRLARFERNESNEGCRGAGFLPNMLVIRFPGVLLHERRERSPPTTLHQCRRGLLVA